MAEGGVDIEIQEIKPVVKAEPPVAEKNEVIEALHVEEKPQVEEAKNESEIATSLENDPDVIEHIDRTKVEALVKKIGEFYNVPQLAVEQGLKSEIYVIKDEAFGKAVEERYKEASGGGFEETLELVAKLAEGSINQEEFDKSLAELNKKREEKMGDSETVRLAKKHAEATGGFAVPQEKEGSLIALKENGPFSKEHTETHEMTHAMSRGGFNEGLFGNNNINLNEATTEILALTVEHPNITITEMFDKIKSGEISAGYRPDVLKMLQIIHAANQGEQKFTVKELAKYYFHDYQEEVYAVDLLKTNLEEKMGSDRYRIVGSLLENDLRDSKAKAA